MNIFSIDFSTQKNDNSSKILKSFLDGCRNYGAEINEMKISDLEIKPCRECTKDVTFQYEMDCRCEDDMNSLYPIFRNNDVWLFFVPDVNQKSIKYLKNLLDRMEPLFQPVYFGESTLDFVVTPDNKLNGSICFLSTCDSENLGMTINLGEHVSSLSVLFAKDFAGSLIRNNISDFENAEFNPNFSNVLEMCQKAGEELVTLGHFSTETATQLTCELVSI